MARKKKAVKKGREKKARAWFGKKKETQLL